MYIQILDYCNFSCEHCLFDCKHDGINMSEEVFKAALNVSYGDYITIGGGEPTLHPNFWSFLGQALGSAEGIFIATNGSQTEISLKLAYMAKKGVISCALSQDQWHEPIDDKCNG